MLPMGQLSPAKITTPQNHHHPHMNVSTSVPSALGESQRNIRQASWRNSFFLLTPWSDLNEAWE
jgi:hypothetical protein